MATTYTANFNLDRIANVDLMFDDYVKHVQTNYNAALKKVDDALYSISGSDESAELARTQATISAYLTTLTAFCNRGHTSLSLGLSSVTYGDMGFVSISNNKYTLKPTDYFVYVPSGNITITLPQTTTIGKEWIVANTSNTITLRVLPIGTTAMLNGAITVSLKGVPGYVCKHVVKVRGGGTYMAY